MNETLLQTRGRLKERAPASGRSGGFISLHQLEGGKLNLSDMDYCVRFGEPKDFAAVRKQIETRRDKIPAWSWWACKKCGWVMQARGDKKEAEGGTTCLKCNIARNMDGGFMRPMTDAEVVDYQKKEGEENARINKREAAVRLFAVNQDRQKTGLAPFTAEQLVAEDRTYLDRKQERERKEAERQAAWKTKQEAMRHKGEIQPKAKP